MYLCTVIDIALLQMYSNWRWMRLRSKTVEWLCLLEPHVSLLKDSEDDLFDVISVG